jgi:aspartyl-tRNA(Asn)/glutamyl-tRNA(Gln) amidotransferase subunit A
MPMITRLTLTAASRAIRDGALSSMGLTQACLERIEATNPRINAIIATMRAQALAQAAILDAEAKAGRIRSPLHGIPIALKDNIDTADAPTTNASELLKHHVPAKDARVVELLRRAGAVIIAKTNLAEFAVSPTNATSCFGPVRNPANPAYVSGGSSGGSAAALATGMCFGALGTDSGGSIRLPSAWCGTVGLKPTLGLVSTNGVGPGIPIIDTTGPMARTVADIALILNQIAGYDSFDAMSAERPREDYAAALDRPVGALRLGVPRRPFFDDLDPEIGQAMDAALGVLGKLVDSVREVSFDTGKRPDDLFTAPDLLSYHDQFYPSRAEGYQPRTRGVIQTLTDALNEPMSGSTAQKLADHAGALTLIARGQRTIDTAFDGFDLLVLPTMKTMPPTVEATVASEYGTDQSKLFSIPIDNTFTFNLLGLPAISVPCGYSRQGLPIGLMIAGSRFSEATLLALAAAYERSTPWHERVPV